MSHFQYRADQQIRSILNATIRYTTDQFLYNESDKQHSEASSFTPITRKVLRLPPLESIEQPRLPWIIEFESPGTARSFSGNLVTNITSYTDSGSPKNTDSSAASNQQSESLSTNNGHKTNLVVTCDVLKVPSPRIHLQPLEKKAASPRSHNPSPPCLYPPLRRRPAFRVPSPLRIDNEKSYFFSSATRTPLFLSSAPNSPKSPKSPSSPRSPRTAKYRAAQQFQFSYPSPCIVTTIDSHLAELILAFLDLESAARVALVSKSFHVAYLSRVLASNKL